jgi:PhnB protein
MKTANPYIYFNGNTEEAFTFYKSVFGGEFESIIRFRGFGENPMGIPEADLDKIAHIALPLGSTSILMGTDHLQSFPEKFNTGNNFCIVLEPESTREAEHLFSALSSGGEVMRPLQKTEWAEMHGECADKFGVKWMVDYAGSVQFSGKPIINNINLPAIQ